MKYIYIPTSEFLLSEPYIDKLTNLFYNQEQNMIERRIVTVSGGFDPIHPGHIEYLKEASKLGEVVVILNSDRFLKKKKGYVFMRYKDRQVILESIKYVSRVVKCIDKDQSVCKTLEWLKPDIFAKGGDRTLDNIPERDVCIKKGIRMIFNVGGGKTQSSSWILKNFLQKAQKAKCLTPLS